MAVISRPRVVDAAATLISWLRARLPASLGLTAPGGIWRVIAIIFALLNLKSLPGIWHIRLFRALWYHIYLQPTPLPPGSLFKPLITSSRSPVLECDYNLHKSNSTYFADADIARTHLTTAILRAGILRANRREKETASKVKGKTEAGASESSGKPFIALGGVACVFRKEIKPYERYEIWTRLLTWDRKWLYIVSHLVKPGTFKPSSYALQPWKNKSAVVAEEEQGPEYKEKLLKSVFATSIAKYVIKKGRITIPAEQVLRDSDLLPEKPEGATGAADDISIFDSPMTETELLAETLSHTLSGEVTWEAIENQRRRGLRYAQMFAGLDGLHGVFDGGAPGILGEYSDMILWP